MQLLGKIFEILWILYGTLSKIDDDISIDVSILDNSF